ncbi:MAG: hypothetical protein LBG60_09375 [Bifidobacteriaceae bacterium]|nr:hypothetical protein [Bifidobacteriaceae bacterium]
MRGVNEGGARSRWRLGDLVEEAWRRLRLPDLFAALLSASLAAGIVIVGALDLGRATDAAKAWIAAGSTVFEITAQPDENGLESLDPFACAAIEGSPSVIAAGASRGQAPDLKVEWEPSQSEVRIWDLTVEAVSVWWPDMPLAGGLFAGADLSSRTGIGAGSVVSSNGEGAVLAGVLPATVLPDSWRAAVVRTVPPVSEGNWSCWMRLDPAAVDFAPEIANSGYPAQPVVVTPYAKADELYTDPASILLEGPGRWVWWAAVAVVTVLEILLGLAGRREAGIYRATGSRHRDLWAMATVRSIVVIGLPVTLATTGAIAATLLMATSVLDFASLWYVVQPVCLYALATLAISPATVVTSASGAVVVALDHQP